MHRDSQGCVRAHLERKQQKTERKEQGEGEKGRKERKGGKGLRMLRRRKSLKRSESFAAQFGGKLVDHFKAAESVGKFFPPFFVAILFKCCLEQTQLETNEQTTSKSQKPPQHQREKP